MMSDFIGRILFFALFEFMYYIIKKVEDECFNHSYFTKKVAGNFSYFVKYTFIIAVHVLYFLYFRYTKRLSAYMSFGMVETYINV